MKKHNYIFDLYETLFDIRTDEGSRLLWTGMAQLYARCGAIYRSRQLQDAYLRMVDEEQRKLREESGLLYPEIDLTKVFRRLLLEAPKHTGQDIPSAKAVTGSVGASGSFSGSLADDPQWMYMIANAFRSMSMRRFGLYPDTLSTLRELKARGNKVFLLSNAQSIFTRPELAMTGIDQCFDAIYISSERGMKKPQPEFMKLLLDEQKLDPDDCMMVGNDTESDVRVALASGVTGCLLNTYHLSDEEIDKRFDRLKQEYPGGKTEVIRSGKIRDLLDI